MTKNTEISVNALTTLVKNSGLTISLDDLANLANLINQIGLDNLNNIADTVDDSSDMALPVRPTASGKTSTENDFIFGDAKANTLKGDGGNDTVDGDAGNDKITGDTGNDLLFGGVGNDTVEGGSENDTVSGGLGNDKITGFTGNDILHGDAGDDSVDGNSGNDKIFGGEGKDTLSGGLGEDVIQGGLGKDSMTGGDGKDVFTFVTVADSGIESAGRDIIAEFKSKVDKLDLSQLIVKPEPVDVVNSVPADNVAIPEGAKIYNNHAYLLSNNGTWHQAEAEAKALGGHLVTVNDQAEQDWITTTFGGSWIGYTDEKEEGNFQWVSGEKSTYTNWQAGEPNNYGSVGENYANNAAMYTDNTNPTWFDSNDSVTLPGVIEIPLSNEKTYNGHTYQLSQAGTWQEAQAEAQKLGGNLVTINDQAEQDWINDTFVMPAKADLWTGYTDQKEEGKFQWVSGETSTYANWQNGEPNNYGTGEDYADTNSGLDGRWLDSGDSTVLQGIIEIPPVVPVAPANVYNGHTYQLSSAATWQEAQAEAQKLGGNLVTINDQAEQDWINDTFVLPTKAQLWTGFNDQKTEGKFEWVSGETSTYTNWQTSSEPNNYGDGENYANLNGDTDGRWFDSGDNTVLQGLIEIPTAGTTSAPVTLQTVPVVAAPVFIGADKFSSTDATNQVRLEKGIVYVSTDADATAEFAVELTGVKTLIVDDFIF